MASTEPDREPVASEPRARAGLRLRLWLGCLGGAFASCAGLWWAASPLFLGEVVEPQTLVTRLSISAAAGIVVGGILALWLDLGIVMALRRIGHGLASRELPHGSGEGGWGEIAELTHALTELLQRHRHLARRSADFSATRAEIAGARKAVERWILDERWEPLRLHEDETRELADTLNRGLARHAQVADHNREAARQIGHDLQGAVDDARESAAHAERGFVEASALLTTVRELQRIGGDLAPAISIRAPRETVPARDAWRDRTVEVIEDLIRASSDSVESLGEGLMRVQAVADRVQVLSNRATLIALNAVVADAAETRRQPIDELKALAREVRDVTGQVDALTRDVEQRVVSATGRMDAVRRSAAERLAAPTPEREADAERRLPEEAERLVERLRDLVLEAAATGERLSAAGERSSTSAERLVRRLADAVGDLEGLVVRLSPPEPGRAPEDV
jgi:methyl-accepting chemotaxis protein